MSTPTFWITVWESFSSFSGFFFPMWPLFVLTPIRRSKNRLVFMLIGWLFGGLFGLLAWLAPYHANSWLIPEPFNTSLYWLTGIALITFNALRWQRIIKI